MYNLIYGFIIKYKYDALQNSSVLFLFLMSYTRDQIHYSNSITNPRGHIQKSIQFTCVVYKIWGQIHLYLKVFKYFFKEFVFDV